MWGVWRFELFDLLVGELDLERRHGVSEMMRLRRADDWRGDTGLCSTQASVSHGELASLAMCCTASYDRSLALVLEPCPSGSLSDRACAHPSAGEPLGERAPWDGPHALVGEEAERRAFLPAVHRRRAALPCLLDGCVRIESVDL